MKARLVGAGLFAFAAVVLLSLHGAQTAQAQEKKAPEQMAAQVSPAEATQPPAAEAQVAAQPQAPGPAAAGAPADEGEKKQELITLDFKEADIRDVLKIIAYKSGVNIVSSPEVTGTVNVRITDVPWERALDVILKTYGYAYDKQDKIIMVAPLEKLTAQRKMEQDLAQVQPTVTEVVELKYIDAMDAKKAIEPQLSPRGKVTVLEITGQAGWGFGGTFSEKRSRLGQTTSRSKTLIISDIPPNLEQMKAVLERVDIKQKQVLVETKLVEINLNKLKDIGFDYTTGSISSPSTQSITKDLKSGAGVATGVVKPANFDPVAALLSGALPFNTGLVWSFQKISGTQFEVVLHALEENVAANMLSAPSILTLDNQEATILVGEQFPIVGTTKSSDTSTTVDVSLEEYKDIGIQLNVVPQVSGKERDSINMIVHPAVTQRGEMVERYPIITAREAQTQVLIKSGETIVIGGLIKDVRTKGVSGVPFLDKIPYLGVFFRRETTDTQKVELLIFITAHIVDEKNFASEQLASLEKKLQPYAEQTEKAKK